MSLRCLFFSYSTTVCITAQPGVLSCFAAPMKIIRVPLQGGDSDIGRRTGAFSLVLLQCMGNVTGKFLQEHHPITLQFLIATGQSSTITISYGADSILLLQQSSFSALWRRPGLNLGDFMLGPMHTFIRAGYQRSCDIFHQDMLCAHDVARHMHRKDDAANSTRPQETRSWMFVGGTAIGCQRDVEGGTTAVVL